MILHQATILSENSISISRKVCQNQWIIIIKCYEFLIANKCTRWNNSSERFV